MIVDVVQLRRAGEKIPRPEALATVPMRGRLRVRSAVSVHTGQTEAHAVLLDPHAVIPDELLPRLERVRLVRLHDDSILITGIQTITQGFRKEIMTAFQQSWWCRLPGSTAARIPQRV